MCGRTNHSFGTFDRQDAVRTERTTGGHPCLRPALLELVVEAGFLGTDDLNRCRGYGCKEGHVGVAARGSMRTDSAFGSLLLSQGQRLLILETRGADADPSRQGGTAEGGQGADDPDTDYLIHEQSSAALASLA